MTVLPMAAADFRLVEFKAKSFRPPATVGAHLVRDALASFRAKSFRGKSFRAPTAPELLLFCLSKREVTKRKRHPAWRLPGLLPGKSVSRGRAFRPDSCPGEKASTSLSMPAARPVDPDSPPRKGPRVEQRAVLARTRWKAEKPKSRSKASLCSGFAFALALLKSARRERAALPVAHPRTRRAGEGMDARVEATQGAVARCPQGAPSGWPLFWLLFSGHPEKSDSPSEGGRKLFALKPAKASRLKPLPQGLLRQGWTP
jgi:hypothetical protein